MTGHKNTGRKRNQVREDVHRPPSARGGRAQDGHLETSWFEGSGKTRVGMGGALGPDLLSLCWVVRVGGRGGGGH